MIDKTSTLNKKADELSIHEWLFGKDTTDFETRKNNFMARQNRSGYNLKQSASRKSLNTVDGTQWTGPVYMGSQNSSMDVIFDNASDWLVVEGNGCINCEGKTFNIDNSSTAKQVGSSFSQRSYGAASMTGSEWTDLVCVTLQACISDFEFFLISDQQGLKSNVDGVLGLSRNKPFFLSQEKGINRGPSYMLALENAGLISENTFSFYLAPFGQESTIDFGAPKDDRMADPSQLSYIKTNDDYFWSSECNGFAIGSTENQWAWGSIKGEEGTVNKGAAYSIFDTGASAIIFPSAFFGNFLIELYN